MQRKEQILDIYNPPEHFKTEEEKEVWNQTLNIYGRKWNIKEKFFKYC